jgi:FdhD protein
MTRSGLPPTYAATAVDEHGRTVDGRIAGEFPLTVYVDRREIVTLMTLGTQPEALTLGYLRNQGLVEAIEQIEAVQVDWDVESVAVTTRTGTEGWDEKLAHRTVTTGCGQGTVFGRIMDDLDQLRLPRPALRQSTLYALLKNLAAYNEVYRDAGAVHGCALCRNAEILTFIEDVGRHNAVDTIAGLMWLDGETGEDKLFYTTGRLTSEMVIKAAQMGIPVLLSRSGLTRMGLEIARKMGMTLIARAKGRHFLIYNGADTVEFDEPPALAPAPVVAK